MKAAKTQYLMFIVGLLVLVMGLSVLTFLIVRKIHRDIQREKLMYENVVIEIPDLRIKAPVLEGTDNDILAVGVGHFSRTGSVGIGNYCIAGHSSTIYKEYFNHLKDAEIGMRVNLYDLDKNCYCYTVTKKFIVNPDETWILNDFNDNRVTIITCTDDGTQRQVIIGNMNVDIN